MILNRDSDSHGRWKLLAKRKQQKHIKCSVTKKQRHYFTMENLKDLTFSDHRGQDRCRPLAALLQAAGLCQQSTVKNLHAPLCLLTTEPRCHVRSPCLGGAGVIGLPAQHESVISCHTVGDTVRVSRAGVHPENESPREDCSTGPWAPLWDSR